MKRSTLILAALVALLPITPARAQAQDEATESALTERNRVLDISAEVLKPKEMEFALFWGHLGIGVLPRVQLSAELAPFLITLANISAKGQLVDLPQLKVSLEAGIWYLVASKVVNADLFFSVPVALRATVPLAAGFELHLAGKFSWLALRGMPDAFSGRDTPRDTDTRTFAAQVTLARYDSSGAFYLQGTLPVLTNAHAAVPNFLGRIDVVSSDMILGNTDAWSVLLGRDQAFGSNFHVRLGIGYRNKPGLFTESIDRVMVDLNGYWRF